MKKILILFVVICLSVCQQAFAQDKLLLRSGDEMLVKVLEITPDSVHFTNMADTVKAKIRAVPKVSVFSITYQNGQVEVLPETVPVKPAFISERALSEMGRADARTNYKASGAFLGTLGGTLVAGPLYGLPVGVATGAVLSITKVPESKIKPSQPELLQHKSYRVGYQKQAQRKKLGNAAAGLATGTALWISVIVIALSAMH